ncbi:CopD family protein [Bradyrhizobium sp. SZCCHNR1070]|uniref:CopD family protein n=1 Tax=Bradyrhizobium sp. SZCCHNR1070 TaxID=3057361 RepID=UPI0029169E6A|nr:CopD family protein [Bradyrhizobium sp. SZCCHNR1070]
MRRSKTPDEEWPTISVLLRFSNKGYLAVTTLVGTGLVNSWYLVGSVPNLLTTAYGRVLLAKLLLFGGMLTLAMANRFSLVPAVMGLGPAASAERGDAPLRKLCKHVLGEQVLGAMIIAIESLLGTMAPGLSK